MKGRYTQKQIENVLRKYISECAVACGVRGEVGCYMWSLTDPSRIRHLQDLQVARHTPRKGEPSVLHDLRVVWIS
jgi:hypothetical protein